MKGGEKNLPKRKVCGANNWCHRKFGRFCKFIPILSFKKLPCERGREESEEPIIMFVTNSFAVHSNIKLKASIIHIKGEKKSLRSKYLTGCYRVFASFRNFMAILSLKLPFERRKEIPEKKSLRSK